MSGFPLYYVYIRHKQKSNETGTSLCKTNMIAFKQSELVNITKACELLACWLQHSSSAYAHYRKNKSKGVKGEVNSFDTDLC